MKQTECCADGFNEPVFLPGTIQIYRPLHFIRATHQRQNPVEDGQQRKRDDKPLRLEDAEQAEQRKEEPFGQSAFLCGSFRVCTEILKGLSLEEDF